MEETEQQGQPPRTPPRAADATSLPDDPRHDRAFSLYCQGLRPPAIAARLEVSASTVRRWLRTALRALADEARAERGEQLQRAIESQRAIAGAAWAAYEREQQLEDALLRGELDRVRRRAIRTLHLPPTAADATDAATDAGSVTEEYGPPHHTNQGARYLAVALAAQREVARLQGLYERIGQPPAPVRITLSRRPEDPEPPGPAAAE